MKTFLLSQYLGVGLILSLAAQEPAVKPAGEGNHGDIIEERTETVSKLREIGIALVEFDVEVGAFPSKETVKEVKKLTGSAFTFAGESSNDYFRQLLATGVVKDERLFQAGKPTKPADNKFTTEAQVLALGECDFSYILGGSADWDTDEAPRPLVVFPLIRGEMKFDPKPYQGKAVILRADASSTIHPINERGEVMLEGKSLFDASQKYWGGKKPQVAWPK